MTWRVYRPISGSLAWAEVPPGQRLYLPGRNRFVHVEPGWFPVDTRDRRWSRELIDRGVVLTARPDCPTSTFRITVSDVGGANARSGLACDLGDAARWLMAVPSAATVARPSGDLGSGYVVTFEDVSSPHAHWLLTERVFPLAAGGSAAFVPATGTAGSGGSRWTVGTGWRWIAAGAPVPTSLVRLGMPEPRFIAPRRPPPDPVTVTFLLLIAITAAVAIRGRVVARRPRPA